MRRPTFAGPGWTRWVPSDDAYTTGRLGYSFKGKRGHADIYPVQGDRTRLTVWVADVWKPGQRESLIAHLEDFSPEILARAVEEVAR